MNKKAIVFESLAAEEELEDKLGRLLIDALLHADQLLSEDSGDKGSKDKSKGACKRGNTYPK